MSPDEFLQLIQNVLSHQDTIIKIIILIFLLLYGLYAIILYNQIRSLNNVVKQIGITTALNFVSILHAILIFVLIIFFVLTL